MNIIDLQASNIITSNSFSYSQELVSTTSNGLNTNSEMCQQLITKYPEHSRLLNFVFERTLYLSLNDVISALEHQISLFNEFRNKSMPIIVVIDTKKIGSEQYFYYRLQNVLPPHYIIFRNKRLKKITEPVYLLFLDDWSLSGTNMFATFDNILYESGSNYTSPNISLVSITAVTTNIVKANFPKLFPDLKTHVFSEYLIRPFIYYYKKYNEENPENKIPTAEARAFNDIFNPEARGNSNLIHLEYKISNIHGSFTSIYESCSKIPPNKEFMTEAKTIFETNSAISSTEYNDVQPSGGKKTKRYKHKHKIQTLKLKYSKIK